MGRRHWYLRRPKKWDGERGQLLLSVLLGACLALFLIHRFDASVRPQLVALSQASIQNQLTHISDQAVLQTLEQQDLSYADLVQLQTEQGSELTILSTNTVQLNALRAGVLECIALQLESLDSRSLGVPLGALAGLDLISALGPKLPVRVLAVSSVTGTYRNDFSDAGINQTLHRILLDVVITARLLFPGGIETVTLTVPVCVAETIIVGQVPQTYLKWDGASSGL